jgi:hypothetical protein
MAVGQTQARRGGRCCTRDGRPGGGRGGRGGHGPGGELFARVWPGVVAGLDFLAIHSATDCRVRLVDAERPEVARSDYFKAEIGAPVPRRLDHESVTE